MLQLAPTILIQQLVEALRGLPNVEISSVRQEPRGAAKARGYDAVIRLKAGSNALTLLVQEKRNLYPRDVQQVVWQLRALGIGSPEASEGSEIVPLVAAETLSPGAKELLRDEQIAYFDSGGSICLPSASAYVFVDRPAAKVHASEMRSLFSGRRAQAIHALLVQPQQWFGVNQLAEQAGVSPATASGILQELEKFEWAHARGQGPRKERQVREPGAVLDAWARAAADRQPRLQRYFVPGAKAEALVDRAGKAFTAQHADYAVSHEAAAQRYAPFLTAIGQVRCRALPTAQTQAALSDLGARPVTEGANLVLIEIKSAGDLLFRQRVGGTWLASPVHVYLDLLQGEGRSREMAAHLRREKIGF